MSDKNNSYRIENFGKESAFASFLPGIAGEKGIPLWCYYVNRGQGVVSFGVDNKDHAIMEFYPAHMAYQNVKRTGFRTFLRKSGVYMEPFSNEKQSTTMEIEKNCLLIKEIDKEGQIETKVTYFILPEERVGALVRKVEITNTGEEALFEVLDGMPNLIPYGVGQDSMKNMTQTAKAWMQVEDHETGLAYYRVRVSMDDSAEVQTNEAGNFAIGFDEEGRRLPLQVDPDTIFGYDLSLGIPTLFAEGGLEALEASKQNVSNLLPACFFLRKESLKKGQTLCFYELIGQVADKAYCKELAEQITGPDYFEAKLKRARELVEDLTEDIGTETASKEFDQYTSYTYMDNVLRGGYPLKLAGDKIYYVYSRKHGDLERDYNYFSMLPEFYSQGNGNYRDINQNRRCDSFFHPFVGKENIKNFYSLIQLDGYNPLAIEKMVYSHPDLEKPFTPGTLYADLLKKYDEAEAEKEFDRIMAEAKGGLTASFGEGYWSDHWTYNLDLVKDYLETFPDQEEELLYTPEYSYFLSQALINPRAKRYAKTRNGIRQYYALDPESKRSQSEKFVMVGEAPYMGTLMEKLILLNALKFAALDPYGCGIEMEGGKPGWYDALNGLPGMLGSSMAESYELRRNLDYTLEALKKYPRPVELFEELYDLLDPLAKACSLEGIDFWNAINDLKEAYRAKTYQGISGKKVTIEAQTLMTILETYAAKLEQGIARARESNGGIIPTYFSYQVTDFREDSDGIHPLAFAQELLPDFLEGSVRYLKLPISKEEKKAVYDSVKGSGLYDSKLSMYKVNSALDQASFEIGRCRAFTPGWLENESIWLHMEYKYLLEVLNSGLYEDFFADLHKALIPFLDPKVYGRSILENSSFLVSSKNPNEKIHGKGFVARLSGSTIEFISMWKRMFFGGQIFALDQKKQLTFKLEPALPAYLIPEDGCVKAKLMSKTLVHYAFAAKRDYIPGDYQVISYQISYQDGRVQTVEGPVLGQEIAQAIRGQQVAEIKCSIK